VEIITGLVASEKVITHGTLKVRPGQVVTVQALDDGTRTVRTMLEDTKIPVSATP
jgi:membrane fusion protein (multidrug efflux system)